MFNEGYLARLRTFDWDGPVSEPKQTYQMVQSVRQVGQAGLWATAHPLVVMAGICLVGCGLSMLFGRRKKCCG